MGGIGKSIVCVVAVLLAAAPTAMASEPGQAFLGAYVAAVNSKDLGQYKKLIHSKSLACMTDANRDYFQTMLGKEIEFSVPPDAKLSVSSELKTFAIFNPEAMKEFMVIPQAPSQEAHVSFKTGPYAQTDRYLLLAEDQGRLAIVMPCPTEKGVQRFREMEQRKRAAAETAKKDVATMQAALKATLLADLKLGMKIEAIRKYRAATSVDLAKAADVVEVLKKELDAQDAQRALPSTGSSK